MLNQIAMIFGYFMLVIMALFCLYVLYVTIRDHFAEKKKVERKDIAELREEVNHMKHDLDGLFDLQCQMIRLQNLVDGAIGSAIDTKKTESAMEEPKGGIYHEEVSGKPEGPDREQVRERGQDEGA